LKKTAAILLLILFLFNYAGYRIVIDILRQHSATKLEALIDQDDYREEELIEIRVALNMPYQQRYTEYERHYGQVTVEGREYTYVKRKVEGDTLILKCLPDKEGTQLKQIAEEISKAHSGHTGPATNPGKPVVKIFKPDCVAPLLPGLNSCCTIQNNCFNFYKEPLQHCITDNRERPPQLS
jgi:hypothetical protein